MLKEEEYRKAVCGKTARTVWWGGGGNPTALLYQEQKSERAENPYISRLSAHMGM